MAYLLTGSAGVVALSMKPELSREYSLYKNKLLNISAMGCATCPVQLGNIDSLSPSTWLCASVHRFSTLYDVINDVLLSGALRQEKGKVGLHSDNIGNAIIFPLHNLTHASLMLKAEAMLQGRTTLDNQDWRRVRGPHRRLECVASGGRFVIFVALQGERGNANVEVGSVSPFDTKRPPKHKQQ